MNYITTNIRIPEEDYMLLKMEAARKRTSISALVRERIAKKKKISKEKSTDQMLKQMNRVAEMIAKENPGLDLTKALIEMRYEQ